MKLSNSKITLFLISVFLIFYQMPVEILADDYDYYDDESVYPNQEHRLCDTRHCENTCATPDAKERPCPFKLCHEGYFCKSGYVREIETDQCILPRDCRPAFSFNEV